MTRPYRVHLAEKYLETLEIIRNLWSVGGDTRHMDIERKDLYRKMLEESCKTASEYPNGQKLAYDIIDEKV